MRKILAIILILLIVFTFIRISTSTYENQKRRNNAKEFTISKESVMAKYYSDLI